MLLEFYSDSNLIDFKENRSSFNEERFSYYTIVNKEMDLYTMEKKRQISQKLKQNDSTIGEEGKYQMTNSENGYCSQYSFETAYISKGKLDIEIVSEDGKVINKPWMFMMMDYPSRLIMTSTVVISQLT